MKYVFNRDKSDWIRPWEIEKFDDLYNRDERFFAIIIKGLMSWLNRNIVLYNKPINHFIFNTGSSYLYMESNGYEYNLSETTGEDTMYMSLPRCLLEIDGISFPTEELTSPYARGNYERRNGNMLSGYNAEIQRLPIELSINLRYYLSNFNETLILLQELIDKLVFQQYYNINYLGQIIQCSIEFPGDVNPELNKIDMTSPDPNQRNITLNVKIFTNYPIINTRTEIPTDKVINAFGYKIDLFNHDYESDVIASGAITHNDIDGYAEFIEDLNNGYSSNEDINNALDEFENNQNELDNIIDQYDTNNDGVLDENDITDTNNIKDIIEQYDHNGDNVIDHNELINEFDLNNDGIVDAKDLEEILEDIKYENTDNDINGNDPVETCHYTIDYRDLYFIIKVINHQDKISVDYDNLTNTIYVNNNETGGVDAIDLIKYKIEK